jgi:hypothetical protein
MLHTRPLRPGDDIEIRRIFRETVALGRPLAGVSATQLAAYEELCLGWYLGDGCASAGVLHDRDSIAGYALVCTDPAAFDRWQRRQAVRFLRRVLPRLVPFRRPPELRHFYRLRVRDGWDLWRADAGKRELPHAHFNALGGAWHGGPRAGRLLADFVDRVVDGAGFDRWYGEINARAGRRTAAIARWGGDVVDRCPNRTLSWLAGEPVERLTVVRRVPERARSVA